jgi:23S rRNA (pseudouridine1915-N3)-methyltransferase
MKLKVAWIGKTREPAIQSLTEEYLGRISHYAQVEAAPVKDEAALLALAGRAAQKPFLVLLDLKGKPFSSEHLAKFLADHELRSSVPLLFGIGPASGFSPQARASADLLLSLGPMTLAHELARVVLLEQLYRGFTILKGHPYHLGH